MLAGSLTVFLLYLGSTASAQELRFRRLSVEQGLPSALVSAVVQDDQGFLWLGTDHGVARFDGEQFHAYLPDSRNARALPIGHVDQMFRDGRGGIWAVTALGVSRYDPTHDGWQTWSAAAIEGDSGSATPVVTSALAARDGTVWVGTRDGLFRLDLASGRGTRRPLRAVGKAPVDIVTMFEDSRGVLWIGARDGLLAISDPHALPRAWSAGRDPARELADDFVRAITEDADGTLWIGTGDGGLHAYDRSSDRLRRFRHSDADSSSLTLDRIARLLPDSARGGVWIGTENGGLDFFDVARSRFVHYRFDPNDPQSLSSNSIWSIYLNSAGLLCVGTYSGGINISLPNSAAIRRYHSLPGDLHSLSYDAVPAFGEDRDGRIWIATDGGGLDRFDPLTRRFERFTPENSELRVSAILSVVPDTDGTLWLGTWGGGVVHADPARRRFRHFMPDNSGLPDDDVYEVLIDDRGSLWIGTNTGHIARLDRANGRFVDNMNVAPPGVGWPTVYVMKQLRDGRLAIGLRSGGLALFDTRTKRIQHLLPSTATRWSVSSSMVRTIFQDVHGQLWVGTDDGLDRIDLHSGARTHWGEKEGLPNRYINGIIADESGLLWISTDRGLTRFDPSRGSFTSFFASDGLHGDEFLKRSVFRSRDGTLYFGGNSGFSTIQPSRLLAERPTPRVVLTELLLSNHRVLPGVSGSRLAQVMPLTTLLQLQHDDRMVTFGFAALEFATPDKILFEYKLEGFDTEWLASGTQRSATYTNLAPHRYVLHVRAIDRGTGMAGPATSLTVEVLPAFWQSWWFRSLVVLVVLFLARMSWRIRRRSAAGDRVRVLFSHSPDATMLFNHAGLVDCNAAARAVLGIGVHDSIDVMQLATWAPPLQPDGTPSVERYRKMVATARRDGTHRFDWRLRRSDGQERDVDITLTHVALDGDRYLLAVWRDISELKGVQRSLEEARDAADAASRAKSDFLANMSHEIRTPLNGVIGMTSLLLDTALHGLQREYARTIMGSGKALLSLLNDILDFSKIEAGCIELEYIDFEAARVIDDTVEISGIAARAKRIDLLVDVAADIPRSQRGDPVRVRQVLTNLVSNAVKFTPEDGSITVRAFLDGEEAGTPMLRFEVEDKGIGIAPEVVDKLFTAFTQADSSTTRRFGGTGLGLAICKRLVELMGGHIGVRSSPGEGSTFWFTVPAPPGLDAPPEIELQLSGVRVLCVDDNAVAREVTTRTLEAEGAKVYIAESATEALDFLEGDSGIDVMICDGMMPGIDGPTLIAIVRNRAEWDAMRIILLSSGGHTAGARGEELGGADTMLLKPTRRDVLVRAVGVLAGPIGTDSALDDVPRTDDASTRPDVRRAGEGPLEGLSILLAEDDAVSQLVVRATIENLGGSVVVVGDGQDAIDAVARQPFDAILMDFHMPVMDGLEATQAIRAAELTSGSARTPIIALTADALTGARSASREAGMDDYLTKPVDRNRLVEILLILTAERRTVLAEARTEGAEPHVPGRV